ncbi:MAG: 23S rRNA (guanosine(2251)-2'-O)-methyltransferase RlmB [Candidatus Makana argininalis]
MFEIIYGINTINEVFKINPKILVCIYLFKKNNNIRLKKLIKKLCTKGIKIKLNNNKFFLNKVYKKSHQGIIALIKNKKKYNEHDLFKIIKKKKNILILILDCIKDPRNLGACLRCAEAAGVNVVIIPKNRSSPINSTVKKVSSGSIYNLKIIKVINISRTIVLLKKLKILVIGSIINSNNNIFKTKLSGSLALVVGSEDKGLRNLTKKYCDILISIPMLGSISSLNVSVATGIILFEIIRQRVLTQDKIKLI